MTGTLLVLTHGQYDELRTYEHGHPSTRPHRPNTNLIRRDLLRHAREHGTLAYRITDAGKAALADYRERHGIRV